MGFDPVSYAMGAKAGGTGGGVTVEPLSVSENGTYQETGKAYSPVTVAVLDTSYMSNITFLNDALPESVKIDGSGGPLIFSKTQRNVKEVLIYNANNVSLQFTPCANLEKITVDGTILQRLNQMCALAASLVEIDGVIDFSAMSDSNWYNTFANCTSLEEIRIKPNTINKTVVNNNFQRCTKLSDDSLVSIANGLDDAAHSLSISLPNSIKTRCGQIVGTVADGVFTQDAAGSVTLTDFITNTKGWTLA